MAQHRRLTPTQRDAAEDREQERYDELFAEIEEAQRDAYFLEFGPEYRAQHPFKPHRVHEQVTARMLAEKNEQ